ncbi:MAG: hypothetical protein R2752_13605 [Vicinamibacterales bacterium]
MSHDPNPLLALKNAWTGVVAASDAVRALDPAVQALAPDARLAEVDLEAYHTATMAQANAVMALRGLVEQLQRQRDADES